MTALDDIARSKYVSLVSYRKDGTAVATPVWHAMNGSELFIVSEADAWKVKRIRNNGHVVVTVCDIRGRTAPGAPSAEGTARLLNDVDTATGRALIAQKYFMSRMGNWLAKTLRIRRRPLVGIAVTF